MGQCIVGYAQQHSTGTVAASSLVSLSLYMHFMIFFAQGLPTSATFKVYHLEHHQFQGVQGLDMDVPTQLEAMIFRGVLGKLAFVILQVRGNLHYSARCSGE